MGRAVHDEQVNTARRYGSGEQVVHAVKAGLESSVLRPLAVRNRSWTAKDAKPRDWEDSCLVLEIDGARESLPHGISAHRLERGVVVPSDNHFLAVGQAGQPGVQVFSFTAARACLIQRIQSGADTVWSRFSLEKRMQPQPFSPSKQRMSEI